jgi:hypothetical protein
MSRGGTVEVSSSLDLDATDASPDTFLDAAFDIAAINAHKARRGESVTLKCRSRPRPCFAKLGETDEVGC